MRRITCREERNLTKVLKPDLSKRGKGPSSKKGGVNCKGRPKTIGKAVDLETPLRKRFKEGGECPQEIRSPSPGSQGSRYKLVEVRKHN